MSWNAGGYGRLTFPDDAAVRAWRKARVKYADWNDWPEAFFSDLAKPFVVDARLKARVKGGVLDIAVDGNTVDLTMDLEEEQFNERVGEVASMLRAAAAHAAKGVLVFLGTAGAEGDFAYRLDIAKGGSKIRELAAKETKALYRGKDYRSFVERVNARLTEDDPTLRSLLAEKPSKKKKTDTDAASLCARFANPKPTALMECFEARDKLVKLSADVVAAPLIQAIELAAKRKPETTRLPITTQTDAMLIIIARRLDLRAAAKALAKLATSKRAVQVRGPAADLLFDWRLELDALAKHRDPAFGGTLAARARLLRDPNAVARSVATITAKNRAEVLDVLVALVEDARAAKASKRASPLREDPRWVKLAQAARDHGDARLGFAAKEALRLAPKR